MKKCPGMSLCIEPTYICDGIPDCEDGSDESPEMCLGMLGFIISIYMVIIMNNVLTTFYFF